MVNQYTAVLASLHQASSCKPIMGICSSKQRLAIPGIQASIAHQGQAVDKANIIIVYSRVDNGD